MTLPLICSIHANLNLFQEVTKAMSLTNGDVGTDSRMNKRKTKLSKSEEEVVRLIGQHLQELGLE